MSAQTAQDLLPRALGVRLVIFASVGGLCFVVQYVLLLALTVSLMPGHRVWANVIAFLLSAQLNFVLSRSLTWGDRRQPGLSLSAVAAQAIRFNLGVLSALGINAAAFWSADNFTHSLLAAVICGNAAGMAASYTASHFLVFRPIRVIQGG